MKIIFLDVDGVLNCQNMEIECCPSGCLGIHDIFVERLAQMVRCTDAEIVLISDWKTGWKPKWNKRSADFKYLQEKLSKQNLVLRDRTYDDITDNRLFALRGEGIKKYLARQRNVESYVILDDHTFLDYDKTLASHLVKTESKTGLTEERMNEAIKRLQGDDAMDG